MYTNWHHNNSPIQFHAIHPYSPAVIHSVDIHATIHTQLRQRIFLICIFLRYMVMYSSAKINIKYLWSNRKNTNKFWNLIITSTCLPPPQTWFPTVNILSRANVIELLSYFMRSVVRSCFMPTLSYRICPGLLVRTPLSWYPTCKPRHTDIVGPIEYPSQLQYHGVGQ